MSSLALGLGFFILFALMSDFFSSFDTFNEKANRIFGIVKFFPAASKETGIRPSLPRLCPQPFWVNFLKSNKPPAFILPAVWSLSP